MPESKEAKTVLPLSCILQHRKNVLPESFRKIRHRKILGEHKNVLSESFMHLPLRPIFRQLHPNLINVRTAYASEIWAQLTKNLLAKSSTKRFREYIFLKMAIWFYLYILEGIHFAVNSKGHIQHRKERSCPCSFPQTHSSLNRSL